MTDQVNVATAVDGVRECFPLGHVHIYTVKVTKLPWGKVDSCVASLPFAGDVTIPKLYVSWAVAVAKVYSLFKQLNEAPIDTGIVDLVKSLRDELHCSLYEAKKVADLLINRKSDKHMNAGGVITTFMYYEEEELTLAEIEMRNQTQGQ
jgi:hypothetical protein